MDNCFRSRLIFFVPIFIARRRRVAQIAQAYRFVRELAEENKYSKENSATSHVRKFNGGELVSLFRDPLNTHDSNAIKVLHTRSTRSATSSAAPLKSSPLSLIID
nr:putative SWI/SNF-related matrix-associated actin-dependent regulator of chromatin subfamily A member 3-like 1 [Ipomoea batatas]GMD81359.1 putative SWI/SNF-related matrix-associated actin-dependent regulator of chromatin subfamily A member 3-like 1 [Ipomoea batatas]